MRFDFLKFLLQDKLSFIKDSFIESLLLFNIELMIKIECWLALASPLQRSEKRFIADWQLE